MKRSDLIACKAIIGSSLNLCHSLITTSIESGAENLTDLNSLKLKCKLVKISHSIDHLHPHSMPNISVKEVSSPSLDFFLSMRNI